MRIFAIESSCDESAIAYLDIRRGKIARFANLVATQAIHAAYGGVVPEVAAREHADAMPHLLDGIAREVVGKPDGRALGRAVDIVAATAGPGLVTSLRVGTDTARALAIAWKKKFVAVNHIEGHIAASWLPGAPLEFALRDAKGVFPAVVLVVSGGHTELLLMRDYGKFTLLGATRDDAAGEAFDKTAKLMDLGYPGGPALAALAEQGNAAYHQFPRPMIAEPHLDFSFSGLKTSVRTYLEAHREKLVEEGFRADTAASVQQAIVDVLVAKTVRAAKLKKAKTVLLVGGVAANKKLRASLEAALAEEMPMCRFAVPAAKYCTDNAAMIAMAGYFSATRKKFDDPRTTDVHIGWELGRSRTKRA